MKTPPAKPQSAAEVMDAYFLETRAKLIEIAANLDRVDRAPDLLALRGDPRFAFIHDALAILQSPGPNRAEQIQRLYSKP
jgi:hypothetical protein